MPAPSTWFITHIGQDEVLQVLLVCAFYSAPTCFLLLALFISAALGLRQREKKVILFRRQRG